MSRREVNSTFEIFLLKFLRGWNYNFISLSSILDVLVHNGNEIPLMKGIWDNC